MQLASAESGRQRLLRVIKLGLVHYHEAWQLQKRLQAELISGTGVDTLILCSHYPVITIGRSGSRANIRAPEEELHRQNVEVFEVERGGDVTFHGPGQLVAYPVIKLADIRCDVGWYMRTLEEVIMQTLHEFGVRSVRVPGRTGVWTAKTQNAMHFGALESEGLPWRKIGSIGVRISRWVTLHGLSLNVANCQTGFQLINPCGYRDIEVTSLEQELRSLPVWERVEAALLSKFVSYFSFEVEC